MSASSSTRPIREKISKLLQDEIKGDVKLDRATRLAYSCDASIFEIEPLLVVLPKSKQDIVKIIQIANAHSISVTARGAATGTTGGAIGKGIIIDVSKYMRSLHFNGKTVRCDPGVVQDDLNQALSFYDLRLGPDTSTGNRATLGGMFANNAAGARSPKFGVTADHVVTCEMVLSDGSLVQFGPLTEDELEQKCSLRTLEGSIYRKSVELKNQNLKFPKLPRRVSGYSLDRLQEKPFNLAKVLAGSEGTLGVITELEMNVVKILPKTKLELHFFKTMREAFAALPDLLKQPYISMEMIDNHIIDAAKESFIAKHHLNWIQEGARCVIYIEQEGIGDDQEKESVMLVRKKGLELLLSKRGYTRAVGFLEDISYPPERSLEFYDRFLTLFSQEVGIYGHVGVGCIHLRPFLDLRDEKTRLEMLNLQEKATDILIELGGSLSGEHGDGLVRSWLNERLYGETIYQAFKEFKKTFDPKNILNPGKIISQKFPLESLRSTPKEEVKTFQDFSPEGGLALSADLCNGNGQCRKKEGLMCPSYQATKDEFDSTRARAEVLKGIINHGKGDLKSKELREVLNLCLECKGCKTECPSSVDMAKMKAEVLYHQRKTLWDYLYGHVVTFWNYFPFLMKFVKKAPKLASVRFSKTHQQLDGDVVLFNDTYTEFCNPNVGESAIKLLDKVGLKAIIPPWTCCGRPLYSRGFLDEAKNKSEQIVNLLEPYARKNLPILVLEPSCFSMLTEDLLNLLGHTHEKALIVTKQVRLIDEFLIDKLPKLESPDELVVIHTHCHQKASEYKLKTKELLERSGTWKVKEIPSGCCGMAGSFGYEYPEVSKKILNLALLPALKTTPYTSLIANGFSCRTQVSDRAPEHVIEFLARKHF